MDDFPKRAVFTDEEFDRFTRRVDYIEGMFAGVRRAIEERNHGQLAVCMKGIGERSSKMAIEILDAIVVVMQAELAEKEAEYRATQENANG